MTSVINQWAARFRENGSLVGKWHFVESVIADRLVTHCGRQLRNVTPKGQLATDPSPAPTAKCERCAK